MPTKQSKVKSQSPLSKRRSSALREVLSANNVDFIIAEDGSVRAVADYCVISFVNCRTHETEIVSLRKGEAIAYGDWNGTECVRKYFECT